jgi:hypothetical protein
MKYTIISTYPEKGSQNIGDGLISKSTINAIKLAKGENCNIQVIWRAADWADVKEKILDSDAIIFACLAIRKNMGDEIYPYLQKLLDSGIPLGAISSGTELPIHNNDKHIFSEFTEKDKRQLQQLNQNALFFTTRGYLSQSFCRSLGLDNVSHSGDIAFWDPRFSKRKFGSNHKIKTIAISDPHKSILYLDSVKSLIKGLKNDFPNAELIFILHGINPVIENFCKKTNLRYEKIFLNKENGLEIYDSVDLHVGYRVHAHVSTLNRRRPSYLLEQDGRGCDYGLTIEKKITVASFLPTMKPILNMKNLIKFMLGKKILNGRKVSTSPVYQILAMINEDLNLDFVKFKGLERQILEFNELCFSTLKKLP